MQVCISISPAREANLACALTTRQKMAAKAGYFFPWFRFRVFREKRKIDATKSALIPSRSPFLFPFSPFWGGRGGRRLFSLFNQRSRFRASRKKEENRLIARQFRPNPAEGAPPLSIAEGTATHAHSIDGKNRVYED